MYSQVFIWLPEISFNVILHFVLYLLLGVIIFGLVACEAFLSFLDFSTLFLFLQGD